MANLESAHRAASIQSPTSSRSSLSIDRVAAPTNARRNRAALRDYYNLASAAPTNVNGPQQDDSVPPSDLDKDGFEAKTYVENLLETEDLETLLKVEAGLVNDIRGIDGERKALVYDNYSKLIAATETIRKMRTNMDPMTPMTNTLAPAISHIAQTAVSLSQDMKARAGPVVAEKAVDDSNEGLDAKPFAEQKATVQWALDAPQRYRELVSQGKRDEAEADFTIVNGLLQKWEGVPGVEELKAQIQAALDE